MVEGLLLDTTDEEENERKRNTPPIEKEHSFKPEEFERPRNIVVHRKNPIVVGLLAGALLLGFVYLCVTLFFQKTADLTTVTMVSRFILIIFTILFVFYGLTAHSKKKGTLIGSSILLLIYFGIGILTTINGTTISFSEKMEDLRGKSITEVLRWAQQNDVEVKQEYEYSDMVEEYCIISQDIPIGQDLKSVKNITVAVSEGASPYKEVILPNMIGWDTDRVIAYVEENYLSKVEVEFIASEKEADTVIEQSKMGSMTRDEEILFTFSYGEERDGDTVKMIDLINKSKFRAIFYLKQNGLKYNVNEDYSRKIKKGNVLSQSKEAGSTVSRENDMIEITISKGSEIKVPDFSKMSLTDITEWIIENKLKLSLTNQYDENVKEGKIIKANVTTGDTVAEGTLIEVTLSKGQLKMPSFKDYDAFKKWANEYGIAYQEEHEFNDHIAAGEVIRYSYKTGDPIKNDDTIIVTISDGSELKVPDLIGMTKREATNALNKLGLNYNFLYKASNKAKDTVIGQSIKKNSSVSKGTTITVTLSKGNESSTSNESTPTPTPENNPTPSTPTTGDEKPSCDSSIKTKVYLHNELVDSGNPETTCDSVKEAYPGVQFQCTYQTGTGLNPGMIVNSSDIDEHEFDHCHTVTLIIAKN